MNKIILSQNCYDQIMYYVNKTNFEISGLGAVEIIDGQLTVTKIYLIEQENSRAETELSGDAISKLLYEHHKSGHPGDLKFWWHSHVNMDVFWSGTDMKTIKELTEHGWFIHGVFNKNYEYKLAFTTNEPVWSMIDDIEMELDETLDSLEIRELRAKIEKETSKLRKKMEKDCDKLYTKCVKEKSYTYTPHKFPRTNYYNDFDYSEYSDGFYNFYDATQTTREEVAELLELGYTPEEIKILNQENIFNIRDHEDYETIWGKDPQTLLNRKARS